MAGHASQALGSGAPRAVVRPRRPGTARAPGRAAQLLYRCFAWPEMKRRRGRCCVQRLKAPERNRRRARARCAWRAARPRGAQAGVHGWRSIAGIAAELLDKPLAAPGSGAVDSHGGRPARRSGATAAVCAPARMRRPGVRQARSRGIRAEEGVLCTAHDESWGLKQCASV